MKHVRTADGEIKIIREHFPLEWTTDTPKLSKKLEPDPKLVEGDLVKAIKSRYEMEIIREMTEEERAWWRDLNERMMLREAQNEKLRRWLAAYWYTEDRRTVVHDHG